MLEVRTIDTDDSFRLLKHERQSIINQVDQRKGRWEWWGACCLFLRVEQWAQPDVPCFDSARDLPWIENDLRNRLKISSDSMWLYLWLNSLKKLKRSIAHPTVCRWQCTYKRMDMNKQQFSGKMDYFDSTPLVGWWRRAQLASVRLFLFVASWKACSWDNKPFKQSK